MARCGELALEEAMDCPKTIYGMKIKATTSRLDM
jgi:hypothetical protein